MKSDRLSRQARDKHRESFLKMAFYNGSGNVYRNNTVAFVPHSGILGRGVNMSFIGNTLDTNCFETTDVGAFYTDGEGFPPLSSIRVS